MIQDYLEHVAEREALGVPPLPLTSLQAEDLVELLQEPPAGHEPLLVDLLENRVSPGVDPAAKVKADFLYAVATDEATSPLVTRERAVELLGTMLGGYNVPHLIQLLSARNPRRCGEPRAGRDICLFSTRSTRSGRWRRRATRTPKGPRVVGGCRVVHRETRGARGDRGHGLQGRRRDQHR